MRCLRYDRLERKVLAIGMVAASLLGGASIANAGPPMPATDEALRALIDGADDDANFGDADYAILLDEADVYVRTSGLATTQVCQLIKVLTESGVRRHCVQRFDYDPATRRVTLERVRVHHSDGRVDDVPLNASPTSGPPVQPTVQEAIYWGGEQIVVSVPNLRIGDVIELRLSKIGFNIAYLNEAESGSAGGEETLQPPMPGHWYEVTLFAGRQPIKHKRYSVHVPSGMPMQFEVYNGPLKTSQWLDGERMVYTFTAEDVPAIKSEPHRAAARMKLAR